LLHIDHCGQVECGHGSFVYWLPVLSLCTSGGSPKLHAWESLLQQKAKLSRQKQRLEDVVMLSFKTHL
jgi:hypothetical protein